jgi:preprotein translocase subunit SecG
MYTVLLVVLVVDSILLLTAVLLQSGEGGGLASLGGGAGTEVFMGGRQAVTLLTKVTWWCAGVFLLLALALAVMSARGAAPRSVLQGNIPAPPPIQSTPLPLQTTPSGATPQQPASPTPPANP